MSSKGITLTDVAFRYHGYTGGLSDVNVVIQPTQLVGIVGANGSGKTTLLSLLNGLIPHEIEGVYSGNVTVDGMNTRAHSVAHLARSVGLVMQDPRLTIFNLTVTEEVAFGMRNIGIDPNQEKIESVLKEVGLGGFANRDPQTLSFGQMQRLAIASCLAMQTTYLVLDEPSAMLDYRGACDLYRLLATLVKRGHTVIVAEHDTDFLLTHAHSVMILDRGRCVDYGPTQAVFADVKRLHALGIKIPHRVNYET